MEDIEVDGDMQVIDNEAKEDDKEQIKEDTKEQSEVEEKKEQVETKDQEDKLIDYAKGCIIGAFIGDAAGAVLEFFRHEIDQEVVNNALTFPGGGAMGVSPGQITDDSEMALSLMRGILRSEDGELEQRYIAEEYLRWYNSNPFDIGMATSCAMRCIDNHFYKYSKKDHLDELMKNIQSVNQNSQSNGCLMRATPLSVYLYGLNVDQIYDFTKRDVRLTHSHPITIHAVTCYNIAIAYMLNNFEDFKGAIDRVDEYIKAIDDEKCQDLKDIWDQTKKAEWEEELITAKLICNIAFSFAFFYLKNNYSYEEAMKSMLLQGGDTDTNAAIAGGLLGARWGIKGIPSNWIDGLNFNNERKSFVELENVQELEKHIEKLVDKAKLLKNKLLIV